MFKLRLDGIAQASWAMQSHQNANIYKLNEHNGMKFTNTTDNPKRGFISQEILSRISGIQVACIAMDTAITQGTRTIVLLVAGIATLNDHYIEEGLRDFISLVAQAIALPILATITIVSPEFAMKAGCSIIREWHTESPFYQYDWGYTISEILLKLAIIPLSSARSALQIPVALLDLDLYRTLGSAYCIVRAPLVNLANLFFSEEQVIKQYSYSAFTTLDRPLDRDMFALCGLDCSKSTL